MIPLNPVGKLRSKFVLNDKVLFIYLTRFSSAYFLFITSPEKAGSFKQDISEKVLVPEIVWLPVV